MSLILKKDKITSWPCWFLLVPASQLHPSERGRPAISGAEPGPKVLSQDQRCRARPAGSWWHTQVRDGHGGKSLVHQSSRRRFRLRMKLPQKLSSPGAAWLLAPEPCSTEDRQRIHPSIHPSLRLPAASARLRRTKAIQRSPANEQSHQSTLHAQQPEHCSAKSRAEKGPSSRALPSPGREPCTPELCLSTGRDPMEDRHRNTPRYIYSQIYTQITINKAKKLLQLG